MNDNIIINLERYFYSKHGRFPNLPRCTIWECFEEGFIVSKDENGNYLNPDDAIMMEMEDREKERKDS